jgi:hypothetical protein
MLRNFVSIPNNSFARKLMFPMLSIIALVITLPAYIMEFWPKGGRLANRENDPVATGSQRFVLLNKRSLTRNSWR